LRYFRPQQAENTGLGTTPKVQISTSTLSQKPGRVNAGATSIAPVLRWGRMPVQLLVVTFGVPGLDSYSAEHTLAFLSLAPHYCYLKRRWWFHLTVMVLFNSRSL
jgi:hypothetical protein